MATQDQQGGSGVLLSAMAGAVLGAAGLAWWLLSEAEHRRLEPRRQRGLRLGRLHEGSGSEDAMAGSGSRPVDEADLHDKVHALNQAIEDVRRQLEGLGSR